MYACHMCRSYIQCIIMRLFLICSDNPDSVKIKDAVSFEIICVAVLCRNERSYFAFETLFLWTSAKGGAYMHFVDASDILVFCCMCEPCLYIVHRSSAIQQFKDGNVFKLQSNYVTE